MKLPKPDFVAIYSNDSVVGQYNLFELNVELNAVFDNAFDPEQIELTATFVSPSGKSIQVDGFYYQDFTREFNYEREILKEKDDRKWLVRFTPREEGIYTYYLHLRNYSKSVVSSDYTFTCVQSEDHGFVGRSETNTIFLEHADKTPYIPVGMSIAWVDQKNGTFDYDYYFKKLKENGCNYSRIWLVEWNLPLEWTNSEQTKGIVHGLGKYSLDNSWRIDYILGLAEKYDMQLLITLGTYGEIMQEEGNWKENIWKSNPYNIENGGMCRTPDDFWVNKEAIKYYQRKLRYVISRWGYSPNILAFELWNEVDAPPEWIALQSSHIKQKDPNKHMVTTSIGYPFDKPNHDLVDATWKLNNIDFVQTHLYGDKGDIIHLDQAIQKQSIASVSKYRKPHFVAEFGIDFYKDDLEYDPKGNGTQVHTAMWSSITSMSMGAAITHWKEYVEKMDLYKEFSSFSEFIRHIDFNPGNWKPIQTVDNFSLTNDSLFFTFPANAEWGDNPDGEIELDPKKPGQKINKYIHSNRYSDQAHFYTPRFTVNMPSAGKFSIHVNEVAENARLVVYIDGQRAWEQQFVKTDHSLKSSYQNEEYKINMLVFDRVYSIPVSEGKHKIKIENEGTNWLNVKSFMLTQYKEKYRVYGISNDHEIVGWINNKNNNWKYMNSHDNPPVIQNISFKIIHVPKNSYNIEWFDPETGKSVRAEKVVCKNGILTLSVPEMVKDKAFIIKPVL